MSRISENIRKITKAWGGKTTGNGISDALLDLYNNLPFGTKVETVEILAEQTVTGSLMEGTDFYMAEIPYGDTMDFSQSYKVVFNNKVYTFSDLLMPFLGSLKMYCLIMNIPFEDLGMPDGGEPFMAIPGGIVWKSEIGDTITVEIEETKKTIAQIDKKYFNPINVVYVDYDSNNNLILYGDVNKSIILNKDLFEKMITSSCVLVCYADYNYCNLLGYNHAKGILVFEYYPDTITPPIRLNVVLE